MHTHPLDSCNVPNPMYRRWKQYRIPTARRFSSVSLADDAQVLVGAGTARPVAASAATYLGVPLGTQGFEDTTYGVRTNEDSQVLVGAGTARPVVA